MIVLMKERGIPEVGLVRVFNDLPAAPGWLEDAYKRSKANPSLLIYKLQNNAYKYGWALIPISVPFVRLLFPFNRRFRGYDHAVFVTHSLWRGWLSVRRDTATCGPGSSCKRP